MGELVAGNFACAPLFLAGIALLKVLLTNVCIQSGLKGGHFFPIIFAGVCLGYAAAILVFGGLSGQAILGFSNATGQAALVFGDVAGHAAFAAAIVTAALLGAIMKKPLAVTVLLFLCFPVKLFLWIFFAAAAGSFFLSIGTKANKLEDK